MKKKHLASELAFYREAYKDVATRIKRGFGWGKEANPILIDLLSKIPTPEKAIDIGIGDGRNTKFLFNIGVDKIWGIDLSAEAIAFCENSFFTKIIRSKLFLTCADLTGYFSLDHTCFEGWQSDLVLDWSVMDHIRREYLPTYKRNILKMLQPGGYLISAQFALPFPKHFNVPERRDYFLTRDHYSRGFTMKSLAGEFPSLKVIDARGNVTEEKDPNCFSYWVILFQKPLQKEME